MVKRISAKEARDRLSDVLGSVYYTKEPVIVEKQGRPFAVLISPEDYERLQREREARFAVIDAIQAKNVGLSAEEAEADALREIAALRREKRARAEEQKR